jgi:hypothetical protein
LEIQKEVLMRTRVLNIVLVFIAFTLTPALASASQLSFVIGKDKTRIKITIPDRYCLLDVNEPSDNRVLTTFDEQAKGKHRRLAFMANCEQLTAWRNGDLLTFDDFGYILLPEESINQTADQDLDDFLNDMVDEIGQGRKNIIRHRGDGYLERFIEQSVIELENSTYVDLGLIHRDIFALYTASLDKITTEIGQQKLSGKVTAITQVNGKPLFFYLFRKLDNLKTVVDIESDLEKWIISVHLAN